MKTCPNPSCNMQNEDSALFCDSCGTSLAGGAPVGGGVPVQQPGFTPTPTPGAGGIACPSCGASNLPGTAFCDTCGASLSGQPVGGGMPPPTPGYPPPTPGYPPPTPGYPPPAPGYPPPTPGYPPPTPVVSAVPPAAPRLTVNNQPVMAPQKGEIVIGRADIASGWNPDVDLTPYGGTPENGVSRKHVKLIWQNAWMVEAFDATNRPIVHGKQLGPGQREPLNNGDTIQLGKIQVMFYGS